MQPQNGTEEVSGTVQQLSVSQRFRLDERVGLPLLAAPNGSCPVASTPWPGYNGLKASLDRSKRLFKAEWTHKRSWTCAGCKHKFVANCLGAALHTSLVLVLVWMFASGRTVLHVHDCEARCDVQKVCRINADGG